MKESRSPRMSRKDVTSIVADIRKIGSPNGNEELKPITVHGTTQWISIRGKELVTPLWLISIDYHTTIVNRGLNQT